MADTTDTADRAPLPQPTPDAATTAKQGTAQAPALADDERMTLGGRALYYAFWLGSVVIPRVPAAVAHGAAAAAADVAWALAGGMRRRATANLRHVPRLAADPKALRRATRGAFYHLFLNYVDFFRGAHLSDAEILRGWTIEGQEHFDAAMAAGKGCILISGHFGNFEYSASRLGAMGHQVVIPAEHMRPEAVYRLFCRLREHHNMRLIPVDSRETLRDIGEALRRNDAVAFLADRYVSGSRIVIPFFGEPATLPAAPMMLAMRSGSPVLAAYCWRMGGGRTHARFIPLDFSGTGLGAAPGAEGRGAARARAGEIAERAMRVYIAEMERRIEANPEQWVSAFSPVWNVPPPGDGRG